MRLRFLVLVALIGSGAIGFAACSSEEIAPPLAASTDSGPFDTGPFDTRADIESPKDTDSTDAADVASDGATVDGDADDAQTDADSADGDASDAADGGDGAVTCGAALTKDGPSGTCSVVVQSWPDDGHTHMPAGSLVTYCTSPPSSGSHYPDWAAYKVYDKPVPYGNLVHSLEHGAIVMLYRCASGMLPCKTTQDALVAIANAQPVDPTCTAPVQRRIIIAPDPTLDVAIGAAAWQWTYRADCVDSTSLGAFVTAHYNKATEDICADGIDPTL